MTLESMMLHVGLTAAGVLGGLIAFALIMGGIAMIIRMAKGIVGLIEHAIRGPLS